MGLVGALGEHADVHDHGDVRLPDPSLDLDPKTHVINPLTDSPLHLGRGGDAGEGIAVDAEGNEIGRANFG